MIESDLELSTTMLLINRRIMTVIKTMQGITKCQLYQFPCSETRLTFLKQQKKREEEIIFSTYAAEILHTVQKSGWEFPENSPD